MSINDRARWFQFEQRGEADFGDEPIVACYLGKLFHFWKGRNAYHGRWSSTYPGKESFCADFDRARTAVERRREQGSGWWIAEIPVLIFGGVEDSLLVTEINSNEPLGGFLGARSQPITLEKAGLGFEPSRPDSVVRIICRSDSLSPAMLPFYWHRSISRGGEYRLDWRRSASNQSLDPILRIAARVTRGIQRRSHP